MNKMKIFFLVVIFIFIFFLIGIYIFSNDQINNFINLNKIESKKNNLVYKKILNKLIGKEVTDPFSILDIKKEYNLTRLNKVISKEPIYYIYNSHQTEEYGTDIYTVKPTVVSLSYMIQDNLEELGIIGILEERNVPEEVKKLGGDYKYSYDVTWRFLNEVTNNNKSIKYLFDIHRDGTSKEVSTATIKDKSYAKIMFLSGERHNNYEKNLKNIKIMEKYLNENYPGILRNTYHQSLYSYNQEFSPYTFLIEVGGQFNTLEEIYNSSIALSDAIAYLMEETYEK